MCPETHLMKRGGAARRWWAQPLALGVALAGLSLGAAGCDDAPSGDTGRDQGGAGGGGAGGGGAGGGGAGGGGAGGSGAGGGGEPGEQTASQKARVKFKGGQRIARDLAFALDLPLNQVCSEFGTLDCAETAHRVTLGGTEPYVLGVRVPLAVAPVTAAIAVDRLALSACVRRVDGDAEAPADRRFFTGAPLDAAARAALSDALYTRLLGRSAHPDEIETLEALAAADPATGIETAPSDRDWAVLACFSVATTLESLFY